MLFNETRQYNIHIFNKIIFLKYRTRQIKARETNKYTYSFDLFIHSFTYTHTHVHTHMHAHTHAHTHTQIN